ncbi:MAG: flagellar export protein FliJ [Pseudomonadota bacterium]
MKPGDRLSRLTPVQRVAQQREQQAATALADSVATLREAELTHAQLVQYRSGYIRPGQASRIDTRRWQDYHEFLDKLDQAVSAQQAIIEDQQLRVNAARSRWQSAHGRVSALGKLIEQLREEQQQLQARSTQRELDERAQHMLTRPFSR